MSTLNFNLQIIEAIVIMVNMVCFSLFIFFEFYKPTFFFSLNITSAFVYLLGML